jgi:hypothetical protein
MDPRVFQQLFGTNSSNLEDILKVVTEAVKKNDRSCPCDSTSVRLPEEKSFLSELYVM